MTSFKSQDIIFINRMLREYEIIKQCYSLFWNAGKLVWKGSSIHRMQSLIMVQNLRPTKCKDHSRPRFKFKQPW